MSDRPLIAPEQVITNGDMSQTIVASAITIIKRIPAIGYTFQWTGTPTGTFSVQVSNDYSLYANGTVNNAGTWTTLPLGGTTTVTASAGNGAFDIRETGFYAVQFLYTKGSGSGTLNAFVTGKVL